MSQTLKNIFKSYFYVLERIKHFLVFEKQNTKIKLKLKR